MMKKSLLVAFASILAAVSVSSAYAEIKAGDTAPDFTLKGSDGKTYKLSQFKGKKAVVIAWFPKAFTGGCTKECISMRENGAALRKYDVAYFTASIDPVQKNVDFAKSLSLDYPILSDPSKKTAKDYGVLNPKRPYANRWTYYIGKNGKVLFVDKKVNAANHAKDMAKKLDELGVHKAH
ncbi:peroxiredoxin [Verrucomicrobia bacterium]|nr:peroxiredoxin [Verrucomicrobiota bacterium]